MKSVNFKQNHEHMFSSRRFSILVLCTVILMIAIGIIWGSVLKPDRTFALSDKVCVYITVTVCPGDTLWDLANQYSEDEQSISDYISQVRSINQLSSDKIIAGESLVIPVYCSESVVS